MQMNIWKIIYLHVINSPMDKASKPTPMDNDVSLKQVLDSLSLWPTDIRLWKYSKDLQWSLGEICEDRR